MNKVSLFDQNDTHFATFDMPELPHKGDIIEIGFPNQQTVKSFEVRYLVHKMVQIPEYTVESPSTYFATCKNDPPWQWEFRLHGDLYDPSVDWLNSKCICAQGVTKCPKHGDQPANRDLCPLCGGAVLGYCGEGVYCTSEDCKYVS